jgi:hypothetical protein
LEVVTLENIKAGKYLLLALKDNGNNKFDPKSDKIGFQKQHITIPNDTIFEVELFKEEVPFKAVKPTQMTKKRWVMGYEGKAKGTKVTVKKDAEVIPTIVTQMSKKDSLQIWMKPVKADSLQVVVEKENYKTEFFIKGKSDKADSLQISPNFSGNLPLRERYALNSTTPLLSFDKTKISLKNKDSLAVDFTAVYDDFNQKLYLDFKKEPLENYKIQLLPGAIVDFFDSINDTLNFKVTTKNLSDYGNLRLVLENVKRFPIIIELTDNDGKVKYTEYSEGNNIINFDAIEPAKYTIRIIYDDNKNKFWDTGSFLEKRQTEEVLYFPKEIDVRANWDVEQPFDLSIAR